MKEVAWMIILGIVTIIVFLILVFTIIKYITDIRKEELRQKEDKLFNYMVNSIAYNDKA